MGFSRPESTPEEGKMRPIRPRLAPSGRSGGSRTCPTTTGSRITFTWRKLFNFRGPAAMFVGLTPAPHPRARPSRAPRDPELCQG
jgi:hypothetical protein